MSKISTSAIRNVALIGHSGEGKTSLAEAILFNAKSIDRLGKVDNGNSTMDYDPEEISRKISISLGVGYANWKDVKINVIDTPGFFDFEGEVVSALHVADSAVVVTSASGQLSVGTEKMLDMAKEKKIPAILFVNGVNKENSSFADTIAAIREKYKNVVVAEIPVMDGLNMVGSVNVLEGKAYDLGGKEIEIPAGYKAMCDEFRAEMVEIAAESNDDYMMKFFDEGDLSDEEMLDGIQIAVKQDRAVLALGGTATANIGITRLMDAIVKYMPDPTARNNVGKDASGKEIAVKCDAAGPVCVQIFKTIVDPFFGKLNIFKVISGTVKGGLALKNVTKDSEEKISTIENGYIRDYYFVDSYYYGKSDSMLVYDYAMSEIYGYLNACSGDEYVASSKNVLMRDSLANIPLHRLRNRNNAIEMPIETVKPRISIVETGDQKAYSENNNTYFFGALYDEETKRYVVYSWIMYHIYGSDKGRNAYSYYLRNYGESYSLRLEGFDLWSK